MKYLLLLALFSIAAWTLDVPLCSSPNQNLLRFTYINGTADSTTTASICYEKQSLVIRWTSIDNQVISTYKNCNDPLYKQDVVEIFISTLDSYPHNYFQFEVSPSSQLFFADITNPYGNCSSFGTEYYSCALATYRAERTAKGWNAELQVKLSVIGRGSPQKSYKVNLFRVDISSKDPIRYLTWQPTFANPPCFHKPAYFQEITLV